MDMGQKIKEYLVGQGMPQRELAKQIGFPYHLLNLFCNNRMDLNEKTKSDMITFLKLNPRSYKRGFIKSED